MDKNFYQDLKKKEFREAVVSHKLRTHIAFQIRKMREDRGWTQRKLAEQAGTSQSAIARLEDPDYGKLNISTLLKLANGFDVGLKVEFSSFPSILEELEGLSSRTLAVTSFADERVGSLTRRLAQEGESDAQTSQRSQAQNNKDSNYNIIPEHEVFTKRNFENVRNTRDAYASFLSRVDQSVSLNSAERWKIGPRKTGEAEPAKPSQGSQGKLARFTESVV